MLLTLSVAYLLTCALCQENPSVTDDTDTDNTDTDNTDTDETKADETNTDDTNKMVIEKYINVALGKPTSQTTTGYGGVAARAVDGNTDGNWGRASCTHTNFNGIQWWEVDLEAVYKIAYIEVYGRTDCCSDRLDNAKLWVGNNKCADLKNMGKAQVQKAECGKFSAGRKVRIEANNFLTLCEVKVMVRSEIEMEVAATQTPAAHKGEYHGDLLNVALHKHTTQSSTHHGGSPSRAVDGFAHSHWNKASCTYARNSRAMTYWEVDLGRVFHIDHLMVYGRTDGEQNVLDGAVVKVGDVACQTISDITKAEGNKVRIDCNGDESILTGRHIRVEKWDSTLTICELQVLIDPEKLPEVGEVIPTVDTTHLGEAVGEFFNVAKGKTATASSEPWGGVASRANDGVTNQNYNQASCSHTYNRGNEWWKVDLGRVFQVDHVRVWGRDDRESPIQGAKLWIGDHRCGTVNAKKKGEGPDYVKCSKEQSAGRYVMIEGLNKYLVLCEVQVMVNKALIDVEPNTIVSEGEILGNYTNVALKKKAWQTSTAHGGVASRAVDGWSYTHWNQGSCIHTNQQGSREWRVDLGKVYKVDKILIWSRTDRSEGDIKWAKVYVGRNFIASINEEIYKERFPLTVDCSEKNAYGKIVTIQLQVRNLMLCEVQVLVKNEDLGEDEIPSTFPSMENVALWKPTNQSSVAHGGTPNRAVDGYTNVNFAHWNQQSCVHTHQQDVNYWEVDLLKEYHIDHLFILARSDSGRERMGGNQITLDGNTVAGLTYTNGNLEYNIPMFNALGRRLRITKLGDYMMFCEFAVYVDHNYDPDEDPYLLDLTATNLAHKKVATSSSEYLGGVPSKALDGESEGNFYRGSCMSTGVQQGEHWWSVDLVDPANVGHVIVYPRLDVSSSDYIDTAAVYVGPHLCGSIEFEEFKRWYVIDCDGKTGSTVTVKKETGMLQFCEVIVQASEF